MKKMFLAASAAAVALVAASAANAAPTFSVTLLKDAVGIPTPDTTPPINYNQGNDFQSNLNNAGLYGESLESVVTLSEPAWILFEYVGSESSLTTSFTYNGKTITETNGSIDGWYGSAPAGMKFADVGSNALLASMFFSSILGTAEPDGTPGGDGFVVFTDSARYKAGTTLTGLTTLYFGYDDDGAGPDDNHDDLIIRATILPVPEPTTWALMIAGVAAVGVSMRRRATSTRVSFS